MFSSFFIYLYTFLLRENWVGSFLEVFPNVIRHDEDVEPHVIGVGRRKLLWCCCGPSIPTDGWHFITQQRVSFVWRLLSIVSDSIGCLWSILSCVNDDLIASLSICRSTRLENHLRLSESWVSLCGDEYVSREVDLQRWDTIDRWCPLKRFNRVISFGYIKIISEWMNFLNGRENKSVTLPPASRSIDDHQ